MKLYSALLIEDDPLVIELARIAAAESFHELDLTVLEGVDAALDWLNGCIAKNERMPQIILMDLKLPKLEGLAVLRTMRNYPAIRDVPIVVFSTEHTQDEVLMSYQVGANSFVAKPADQEQFSELLREQLAYWIEHHMHNNPVAAKGEVAGRI
jgi:CheY-like chemotaxis protein